MAISYQNFIEQYETHALHYFRHFKAVFQNIDDTIQIVDWFNENGSSEYSMRIIFDINKNTMLITGDLGTAVYEFTEPATLEAISKYNNFEYFESKLKCSTDVNIFDDELAEIQLKERLLPEDLSDKGQIYKRKTLIECILWTSPDCIDEDDEAMLADIDPHWDEWLFNIGKLPAPRHIIYWQALKSISNYLANNVSQNTVS